jgi:RNA polymerase primary sigma factor
MTKVTAKQTPTATPPRKTAKPTDPIEAGISDLIAKGRQQGFLTWEELNDALPDEAIIPDRLEGILLRLEESGIDMVDEADARKLSFGEEAAAAGKKGFAGDTAVVAVEDEFPVEAPSRRIDDPVRMYLTQMGEIPLLTRTQEIALAKKIELTRLAFRRKVLEPDCSLAAAVEILQMVKEGTLPLTGR